MLHKPKTFFFFFFRLIEKKTYLCMCVIYLHATTCSIHIFQVPHISLVYIKSIRNERVLTFLSSSFCS